MGRIKGELALIIVITVLLLSSCIPIGGGGKKDSSTQFLVLHNNPEGKLGEGAYMSMMKIEKGEPVYKRLHSIYPATNVTNNIDLNNRRVALGLHYDFNPEGRVRLTVGAWFDIDGNKWEELPLLSAGDDYRFSYYDIGTSKVSESGHVFYLSSSNDRWYFDQYRASLVRYDPVSKELLQAPSLDGFVRQQPEKGWDTEAGLHSTLFYPSDDGRYVYGFARAFGVDGGAIHWDYEILYKYDFNTSTYTRIGDAEDRSITLHGITADKRYLLYTSSVGGKAIRKIVNTQTNETKEITITGGQGFSNNMSWNNKGYCSGSTISTLYFYDLLANNVTEIKTPARPYIVQFSPDGSYLYFYIESSTGKYLCKTSDLTSEAVIDTVSALQFDVREFMVIR